MCRAEKKPTKKGLGRISTEKTIKAPKKSRHFQAFSMADGIPFLGGKERKGRKRKQGG